MGRMTDIQKDSDRDYSPPGFTTRGLISNNCMLISIEKKKKHLLCVQFFIQYNNLSEYYKYQMNVISDLYKDEGAISNRIQ